MMKLLLLLQFVIGLCILGVGRASPQRVRLDEVSFREKRNTESSTDFTCQPPQYPRDCKEVNDRCEDQSVSGVYLIKPEGAPEPFEVYCNNSIDRGGWTVLQRRLDGSVDFFRYWKDYKNGFGFLRGEFWLGNDKISYLTNQKRYELRIDFNNVNGQPYFAKYDFFRISDEFTNYRLVGVGNYDSTSTAYHDSLNSNHINQTFCTRDRDNDGVSTSNLAVSRHGAWWFKDVGNTWSCHLNGLYDAGSTTFKSIAWHDLPGNTYFIKYTEMKIRPV